MAAAGPALVLALWALASAPIPPSRPVPPNYAAPAAVAVPDASQAAPAASPSGGPIGRLGSDATPGAPGALAPSIAAAPFPADTARRARGVAGPNSAVPAAAPSGPEIVPAVAAGAGIRPAPSGGPLVPMPPARAVPPRASTSAPPPAPAASGTGRAAAPRSLAVIPARLPDPGTGGGPGPQPDQFVCRDPRLAGAMLPEIGEYGAPCGVTHPVRLTGVSGIGFDAPATLDCPTARRVAHWLTGVAEPLARQHFGSRIVEVDVMGSYACRTRNNRPGGRISEHAMGRAIDVGGFTLADGRRVSVKEDWGRGAQGKFLSSLHRQSCGLFMTVLGPEADRFHHDHLHLDTARRNGDTYCR